MTPERWEYPNTICEVLVYDFHAFYDQGRVTICCNYFYICVKWPLTHILTGIKAYLLEDKQISSVRVFDEVKSVTLLGGHLTPKSCKYDQMLP